MPDRWTGDYKIGVQKALAYDDAESGRKRQESDVTIAQIPPPFSAADEARYWPKCIVHAQWVTLNRPFINGDVVPCMHDCSYI